MTAPLVVFFVLAALAILGALSLIWQKHPIHSALSLIVVMVALAGLYLLMGAEFVAAPPLGPRASCALLADVAARSVRDARGPRVHSRPGLR